MNYAKYHALGNDYLVLDPKDASELPAKDDIVRICHRNFGLGSDGILYGPLKSDKADFGLRIMNPDGSEAEKSGNGLRIFARYLYDTGAVGNDAFTVDTLGGIVTCKIADGAKSITVDMGKVNFAMNHIPVDGPEQSDHNIGQALSFNGKTQTVYIADIGNPHCVVVQDEISAQQAHEDGAAIEVHEAFPNRTNVQFLKVIDRNNIQIEIWERGAGYTLASGSSSSAAAAVAHRIGLCDRDITVHMPGGKIGIHIGDDFAIRMTGPATHVASMQFDEEALSFAVES
ncbi:diaminopimelate epimerase [Coraliomargarita algicola]|uniref:Diaminopimelate epimerase n=1 Tax=Coraliomargarita algicola TaxID=3092156 RepID=A0ABZ0RPY3_9BACT|nr:diaminopimelate epimerase [Coraliomargarita sp. J2-16]WPJ98162.1 diaminopimelate epimerase [Coraliomargarita sp. J2-16]